MSLPYHERESRERAVALLLSFVDPSGAIIAGVALARYAFLAIQSLLHHGGGYPTFTIVLVLGEALLTANPTALIAPIARGFGVPARIFARSRSGDLSFWLGIALIVAAYMPTVTRSIETYVPFMDYEGTAALATAALVIFWTGVRSTVSSAAEVLRTVTAHIHVSGKNRTQQNALAGELLLCGGVAHGVFRERNITVGAPSKGEILLYGVQSARRGTVVIGAPGSSKTRSKIYPDLYWGLRSSPRAGALVFVTKRRATQDCYRIARTLRPADYIHIVGIGAHRATMDITARMTHESIGDAIQDGLGSSTSDFWRHGPSAFVEGFIEIIQTLAPSMIHVPALADEDGIVHPGNEAYDLAIDETLPTLLNLIALDARRLDAVFAFGFERARSLDFGFARSC
jgi:hypothetical protein